MMYQFQRSFIKAASEFVDVYGRAPEEEPHLPVAVIPPAPLPPHRPPGLLSWGQSRAGARAGCCWEVTRAGGIADGAGSAGLAAAPVAVAIGCC